jgi:hypothetical protein
MILIFPPVAKPCEPPAGMAKLNGALKACGISCTMLDANLEGLVHLLARPKTAPDAWTRRAIKNCSTNLAALRDPRTYQTPDRYSRAVRDVQRLLAVSAGESGAVVGLADYQHNTCLRSGVRTCSRQRSIRSKIPSTRISASACPV